jgi:hypothetical protein
MNNTRSLLTLAILLFATSCATNHSREPGSQLGSVKGIAAFAVVLLTDKPGSALVELSSTSMLGPRTNFEIESGTTYLFRDMLEGSYRWDEMRTTTNHAPKVVLKGSLPDLMVKRGCIAYFGEIAMDLRGNRVQVMHTTRFREKTLAKLKEMYPAEFKKLDLCR